MNDTGMRPPKAGWRVAATLAVLVLCGVSVRVVSLLQGPVEGPLAVRQIEDDAVDYTVGRAVAVANIPGWIEYISGFVVVALWVAYVLQYSHYWRQLAECERPENSL